MFDLILGDLSKNFNKTEQKSFPNLRCYLERHIEIDSGEHSHEAFECLNAICENDEMKWKKATTAGINSLILRSALWDEVEKKIVSKN